MEFSAGLELKVDKAMAFWVGIAEGELMFIPRKPTPLNFMLKIIVDTTTGIFLNTEIIKGADKDAFKLFNGI